MGIFQFDLVDLPPSAAALREEVREFLDQSLEPRGPHRRVLSWSGDPAGFDREFSRKVAERGWIGMMWPKQYGGHEQSAFERFVVLEEMIAAGAPVSAHWVADRQSGPLLLRFGTEEQRQRFLPRITRGELAFCIGMSESDAGSDLAAIRTRADKVDGGYRLNGAKIWTSNAHRSDYMIGLFRSDSSGDKHDGLTQLLVDMTLPGITIRPIVDLSGAHVFNEVAFQDAVVPDDLLVGEEGAGWKQATTELGFERAGPERYMTSIQLLFAAARELERRPSEEATAAVGRLVAHLTTLRQMSLAVAGMVQAGKNPGVMASLVKDVGGSFEQDLPESIRRALGAEPRLDGGSDFERTLGFLTEHAPSFSLRAGTREILRGIIARGLGVR